MQGGVSVYFGAVGALRSPERLPQTEAEERRMSKPWAIAPSSGSLELDEKRLELRRPRVGVHRRRCQEVRQRTSVARVARGVAPVQGKADLPHLLAVDFQRDEALGHHGDALDRSARGGDLDLRAVG